MRMKSEVYIKFINILDEGLTPSKAIRSFITDCNGQGAISVQDARYMARYGISQMR
jgi:antitoxin component of RelBE/YafQ-DinJ toxin-antitoxin module